MAEKRKPKTEPQAEPALAEAPAIVAVLDPAPAQFRPGFAAIVAERGA